MNCAACGKEVPAGFRFCGYCGASIVPQETPAPAADQADRRQLTVMFCDLVDYTRLAEQRDPEELREVVRAYQAAAASVVEQSGGHVAQYLGDGILVYFGYPHAHEDDPRRAVYAALETVQRIDELSIELQETRGIELAVRIGVHTGVVVAGDVGSGRRQEQLALGSAPNIAARLQAIASPGAVIIGEATHRLIEGFFECESLGPHELKGRTKPEQVFRVVRRTGAETRFDVQIARGLSPQVGRTAELTRLEELFANTRTGKGGIVLVRGEAGIGKSRLVQLFRQRIGSTVTWIQFRGSVDHQTSALRPVTVFLERLFQFERDDSPEVKLGKIVSAVESLPSLSNDVVPVLASLLSVPTGEAYPPLHLTPRLKRTKTQEAVLTLLLESENGSPIVLSAEDVHWVDPSTLELLELIGRRIANMPVLLLCTARPAFEPSWGDDAPVTVVHLGPLDRDDVVALATSVAGERSLPAELIDQLVAKTDGVPLYVEELTKMVLESGLVEKHGEGYQLASDGALAIPDTLHDSLIARLDRLGAAKAVWQLGSVIGREFSFAMIRAVATLDDAPLEGQLAQLVDAGLLEQKGAPPRRRYVFIHALIRDAAYESLLHATRRRHHQAIAEAFAEQFPEMMQTEPEVLAHHYTEGGVSDLAINAWVAAGERGAKTGSTVESIAHFRRGLALVEAQATGLDRDRRELLVQVKLGDSLSVAQGYASPEVAATYDRARELESRVGEHSSRGFEILGGLHRFHFVRADLGAALDIATELHERARGGEPVERIVGAYSLGLTHWIRGEFTEGLPVVERGLDEDLAAWGSPTSAGPGGAGHVLQVVQVRVQIRNTAALLLSHLGYVDRALALADEQLSIARAAEQPYSVASALYNKSIVHFFRREPSAVAEHAQRLIEVSREHGYFFAALGSACLGWALGANADLRRPDGPDEAVELLRSGLGHYRAAGARAAQTAFLAMLAETHLSRGETELAHATLDEGDAVVAETQERYWLPELHRLRGAIASAAGDDDTAEAAFGAALGIAREQANRLLELRAAVDLARVWRARGDVERARELIRPILDDFKEGATISDWREAAALLETPAAS